MYSNLTTHADLLVIVQARMGSQRLPGKVLRDCAGKPLLEYLLEALGSVCERSRLVVATSEDRANDPLEAYLVREGVHCFRGDEENVASRFVAILEKYRPQYFARVSGDSPLFHPGAIQQGMALLRDPQTIVSSTRGPRPYPSGSHVEFLPAAVFLAGYPEFQVASHYEHVTTYFYEHPDRYQISGLDSGLASGELAKLSVDTEDDFRRIELVLKSMDEPHYHYSLGEKCARVRAASKETQC